MGIWLGDWFLNIGGDSLMLRVETLGFHIGGELLRFTDKRGRLVGLGVLNLLGTVAKLH